MLWRCPPAGAARRNHAATTLLLAAPESESGSALLISITAERGSARTPPGDVDSFTGGTRGMSDVESSATVVPLKPAPVRSKAREPSGKRPSAKRPRKRQPAAAQSAAAAPVSLSQAAVLAPERAHVPSRPLALTVFGIGLLTAA